MDGLSYVADGSLGAVPLERMRILRSRLQSGKPLGSASRIASDRPVIVGNQRLTPNVLYPSSNNPNVRYYLPLYTLAVRGGKPDVELRYKGEGESGELGRLAVGLTWVAPAAPAGVELRVMDHVAELELRYSVPVGNKESSTAGQDVILLQPAQREGDQCARSVTVFSQKTQFDYVYQAMRDESRQAALRLRITARVGVKTWRQVTVGGSPDATRQLEALDRRGALLTQVFSAETLATAGTPKAGISRTRVVVKPIEKEEQARVSAARTQIEKPRATTRVAPNLVVRPTAALRPNPAVAVPARQPATAPPARGAAPAAPAPSAPEVGRVATPSVRMLRVAPGAVPPAAGGPRVLRAAAAATAAAPVLRTTPDRAAPQPARAVPISGKTLSMVNRPQIARAIDMSDLKVKKLQALPIQIALGANAEPAILETDLDVQQSVPFHFDPSAHPNVYAAEGFSSQGPHLLLELLLTVGGRVRTVYQDNMMPEVIHVAPTEFRLVRDSEPPYLPGLSLLPADFGTAAGDGSEAELLFQMAMSYELEPWIDPAVLEAARNEVAASGIVPRFTPILPQEAQLTLELDALGAEQQRTSAKVEAATGITDTLVLDNDVFTQTWRERLARPGAGIGGRVHYRLFDGTESETAVSISLWGTSTDVFDVDFVGSADQPDRYRVSVRNKIESPVTIESLPVLRVGAAALAAPVAADSLLNRKLKPQEAAMIDYQVTPAGTLVESLAPLVYGTVEPDVNALLRLLMLSPGYKSLSFTVPVSAAPGVFGAASGSEAISGLLVEFDDGSRAELRAESPATDVTLVGRLVDQILGTSDDQHRYLYRVTNLHASGEGARGNWREGQGVAPLQVGAVTQLDF